MISAKAFAPANISCIFKVYEHKSSRWMGSYGLGFTLDEGVIVSASTAKRTEVAFNNKPIGFATVKNVIKSLTKENLRVHINSRIPLGCGFGLSGASALATAYAANELLGLEKSKKELAVAAHIAEVECKTGLGDVVNQFYGGFCLKLKPSSHFIIEKLPINGINVYCRCFGRISTKSIITNQELKNKISDAASMSLNKIEHMKNSRKQINFREIIKISKEFAVNSRLLKNKKVAGTIMGIEKNNGSASMIMLGNAVFSDTHFKGSLKLRVSDNGAKLL
ncbi:hypothetical protein HYY70_05640 [Candidatus Woesearchaeota archaeon]|nr:hypothetical protein [Candidatus Woesearchaeota archaeon]